MSPSPVTLTEAELQQLTGYRQKARMRRWLAEALKIRAPVRADGLPIVSRTQLDLVLSGAVGRAATAGPNWSK